MNEQFNDPNFGCFHYSHTLGREGGSRIAVLQVAQGAYASYSDSTTDTPNHHAMGRFDQAIFVDHKGKDPILGPGTRCSGNQFRKKAIDPSVTGEREAKCRNSKRLA